MFINHQTQLIVTLEKFDQEALTHLLTQLAKHTQYINFMTAMNDDHPILTLCFESLNSLSALVGDGIIAGIDIETTNLFLVDDIMSTVDNIAIYDGGIPIDKMIIAPRVARSFIALTKLYLQELEDAKRNDEHFLPPRNEVPGFMDLTKTRKVARSVDSIFGDSSGRTFERHNSRHDRFEHSIHCPRNGVRAEIRGKDLFLNVDGQVLRRGVDDVSDTMRTNIFRSELLRGIRNGELMDAIADYPNVKLVSHGSEYVEFTVTVESKERVEEVKDTKDGLFYLHEVMENLDLLTLTLKENFVLSNVKVPAKSSGPLKGSIANDLLAVGDKSRADVVNVNYSATGSGIELVFSNEKLAKEFIANIEAKQSKDVVEAEEPEQVVLPEHGCVILTENASLIPVLYMSTIAGVLQPTITELDDHIVYEYKDKSLKKVNTQPIRNAVKDAPLSYVFISHDVKLGVVKMRLARTALPLEFTLEDNKLSIDGDVIGVVAKWNNSFTLHMPAHCINYNHRGLVYGLCKALKVSIPSKVVTSTEGENELVLSLGKGQINRAAKKLLADMYTTIEPKTEEFQEQLETPESKVNHKAGSSDNSGNFINFTIKDNTLFAKQQNDDTEYEVKVKEVKVIGENSIFTLVMDEKLGDMNKYSMRTMANMLGLRLNFSKPEKVNVVTEGGLVPNVLHILLGKGNTNSKARKTLSSLVK